MRNRVSYDVDPPPEMAGMKREPFGVVRDDRLLDYPHIPGLE
jgi:hypothetical protein